MYELIRFIKKKIIYIVTFSMRILPVKQNRVLLHNDIAQNYSANIKAIAEYLFYNFPGKFDLVISVKDLTKYPELLTRGMKVVKFNSVNFFRYAITAKIFVSNSGGYSYIPMRKSQFVINTWHGGGAYKKCGIDMYNSSYLFKKDLKMNSTKTNIILSTCSRFTKEISKSMLIPKEKFWEIGMPRNDMLMNENKDKVREIKNNLKIPLEDKLVLFAPTYRKVDDNYFKDSIAISYGIDKARVCTALKEKFGGNWHLGIRYHPCVINNHNNETDNIINLTDYPDMQDLLLVADVLINDFSSSMWDFMLTGKPCFLFAQDMEHYIKTTDLYTLISELPFSTATNNEELEKNILDFDKFLYKKNCLMHYENMGGCESGHATELVCNLIFEKCYY